MSAPFPKFYLHHFTCSHRESHHGILVSDRNVLAIPHPCARCEPHTAAGQDRLRTMLSWNGLMVPYLTKDGDVVVAHQGSTKYPALLSVWERGGRCGVEVLDTDEAEARAGREVFGMVRG